MCHSLSVALDISVQKEGSLFSEGKAGSENWALRSRDDSMVRSTYCFYRRSGVHSSIHIRWFITPYNSSYRGSDQITSYGLPRHLHSWTPPHTHNHNKNELFKTSKPFVHIGMHSSGNISPKNNLSWWREMPDKDRQVFMIWRQDCYIMSPGIQDSPECQMWERKMGL